jgi:two-component system, chemotaxis family, CheB/CheR fusion protein
MGSPGYRRSGSAETSPVSIERAEAPFAGAAPRLSRPSGGEAERPPLGLRILVVDDSLESAESLALLLQLGGHEVRTAHDGESALQMALQEPPQVVFQDISMPGISGLEVARRLRQQPPMVAALLVAVSGYGQPEDQHESRAAGFDHHLVKPLDLDVVLRLLHPLQAREAAPPQ